MYRNIQIQLKLIARVQLNGLKWVFGSKFAQNNKRPKVVCILIDRTLVCMFKLLLFS